MVAAADVAAHGAYPTSCWGLAAATVADRMGGVGVAAALRLDPHVQPCSPA